MPVLFTLDYNHRARSAAIGDIDADNAIFDDFTDTSPPASGGGALRQAPPQALLTIAASEVYVLRDPAAGRADGRGGGRPRAAPAS